MLHGRVAVENDYNAIVFNLNQLVEQVVGLMLEMDKRLLEEKANQLDPNARGWVNMLAAELPLVTASSVALERGAWGVLNSRPGEAVFKDQPPPAPDVLP